ncbi:MAG: 30S ribosomal protein S9 [Candidatus Woesearchaeota archaeon]
MIYVAKRKESIARANIVEGTGKVFINNKPLELFGNQTVVELLKEPLIIAGDLAKKVDIYVNVTGGGISGKAQAARTAIGKALAGYFKNESLKKALAEYDKHLLVSDVRLREPRKPWGASKARAKRQKSYGKGSG